MECNGMAKPVSYLIVTLVVWFPHPVRNTRHRDSAYIQPYYRKVEVKLRLVVVRVYCLGRGLQGPGRDNTPSAGGLNHVDTLEVIDLKSEQT